MLLCKETFWFYQNVGMFYWQHICYVWWIYFSTDSRHSHWYQLCSSSSRRFPLLLQGFSRKNEKQLSQSFNFTFHYTEDVLSLNNSKVVDFVDYIYPTELEIKDTTGTARSASYLDLHLEIDSESRLRTNVTTKEGQITQCPNENGQKSK
jgi:hypothetical protein